MTKKIQEIKEFEKMKKIAELKDEEGGKK